MTMNQAIELTNNLDLSQFIKSGDLIMWSQASAEPITLTRALVEQRHSLGRVKVFLGVTTNNIVTPECADVIDLYSYCCVGVNKSLHKAGVLDVVTSHYSQLPYLVQNSNLTPDVVFLHLSKPGPDGKHSVGIVNDYVLDAAAKARIVIAEVNEKMPWVYGSQLPANIRIDAFINSSQDLADIKAANKGVTEQKIAQYVAELIPDGATLEMGIGALPDTIISALKGHKHLGIHSGMLGDSIVDLIESGAVDNSRKQIDIGISVAGVLMGSQKLYDFARENKELCLRSSAYTHNALILAQLNQFYAINSAIEVDLTGQINAEIVNGAYVGAIGGQADFIKGSQLSSNGRSIIALPSVTKNGAISRIVPKIDCSIVTTTRSDADIFVTEWGVAELRGQPIKERINRMINIAHPDYRDYLQESVDRSLSIGN